MKEWSVKLAFILSLAALGISIYVLINGNVGWDSVGAVIDTLAILVTVLIGYQILNALQLHDKIDEARKKIKEDCDKEIEKAKGKAMGVCLAQFAKGMREQYASNPGTVFSAAINALVALDECLDPDDKLCMEAYDSAVDSLYEISRFKDSVQNSRIKIQEKALFMAVASKINEPKKRKSILAFIDSLSIFDDTGAPA